MAKRKCCNEKKSLRGQKTFLNELGYRTDGNKAYKLMNTLNNKNTQRTNHPIKRGNKDI